MDSGQKINAQQVEKRYAGYGMLGGAVAGMLAGLMYTGPHFREWSFGAVMAIVSAAIIVGGLLGYGLFDVIVIPGVGLITSDDSSGHTGSDSSGHGHHHTHGDANYDSGVSEWHDGGGF